MTAQFPVSVITALFPGAKVQFVAEMRSAPTSAEMLLANHVVKPFAPLQLLNWLTGDGQPRAAFQVNVGRDSRGGGLDGLLAVWVPSIVAGVMAPAARAFPAIRLLLLMRICPG